MKLSIVIASHGSEHWRGLALSRAYPSAISQAAHEVLIEHDPRPEATRAEVRNRLVDQATGDWICTLDADDELAPGYAEAMSNAEFMATLEHDICCALGDIGRSMLLLAPRVQYLHRRCEEPRFPPEVDINAGNWMVVGTLAPRNLMLEVGGWRTLLGSGVLNQWDDWDMWIRCVRAGARIVKVPEAIYVAHAAPGSPQQHVSARTRRFWLEEIKSANSISLDTPKLGYT